MIEKLLKDSDGYLSVYESEFHDQVGIGCENIQNNDFLKIPRDFSDEEPDEISQKPVLSVVNKDTKHLPQRFSVAQQFEIGTQREETRKSQIHLRRSTKIRPKFRKTGFAQARIF